MIVVDASVLAVALGDDGHDGAVARDRLIREVLTAPELIDLEVVSVWRKQTVIGKMDKRRAELAVTDLMTMPLRRAPHAVLLRRCWELRHNLTIYDAAYLALAELLDVTLVTADAAIASVRKVSCHVELLR